MYRGLGRPFAPYFHHPGHTAEKIHYHLRFGRNSQNIYIAHGLFFAPERTHYLHGLNPFNFCQLVFYFFNDRHNLA